MLLRKLLLPLVGNLLAICAFAQDQRPLIEYAEELQRRILQEKTQFEYYQRKDYEIRNMDLQAHLNQLASDRNALDRSYESLLKKYQKLSGDNEAQRQQYEHQLDSVRMLQANKDMEIQLYRSIAENKDDSLNMYGNRIVQLNDNLNRLKFTKDSLIKKHQDLKIFFEMAMNQLSGIQFLEFGIKNGENSRKALHITDERSGEVRFGCPQFALFSGNCSLDVCGLAAQRYVRCAQRETADPVLLHDFIIYKKEGNRFVYHSSFKLRFVLQNSPYEGWCLYTATRDSANPLERALESGEDYRFAVVDAVHGASARTMSYEQLKTAKLYLMLYKDPIP